MQSRMRSFVKKALVLVAVSVPLAALAAPPHRGAGRGEGPAPKGNGEHVRSVPEFDPSVAGTIAALVVAGSVVLAARRRRP